MRFMSMRCRISGKRARLTVGSSVALLAAFLIAAGSPLRAQQAIQVYMSAVDGEGKPMRFNRELPKHRGVVATNSLLSEGLQNLWADAMAVKK